MSSDTLSRPENPVQASRTPGAAATRHYDVAVFIGRMQPYHLAHHAMVQQALSIADRVVLVLGSALRSRDPKNPFTWQERRAMVLACFDEATAARIEFAPVEDFYDDDEWVASVRSQVQALAPEARSIALVGHFKDASSYYLNRFRGWDLVEQKEGLRDGLSATTIRKALFSQEAGWPVIRRLLADEYLPMPVVEYLSLWRLRPEFEQLRQEAADIEKGKAMWASAPYEVTFTTVDAVVTCNDHVLMVQRGRSPGKGLWALPGGFLEPSETLLQSAMRELQEETRLGMLASTLESRLTAVKVFDHPGRSLRGRTITHAHYFDLGQRDFLPEVHGSDDAVVAKWIARSQLEAMREQLFEDHYSILRALPRR